MRNIPSLMIALALCFGVEMAASHFTAHSVNTWYSTLAKPFWTPPKLAFPIVWTILYTMMAISVWLVWKKTKEWPVLLPFGIQLALNFFWSLFFFGWQNPGLGLIDIILLFFAIWWTISTFAPYSKVAAWLLVPYLAWVGYAASLNAYIWWFYVHPGA